MLMVVDVTFTFLFCFIFFPENQSKYAFKTWIFVPNSVSFIFTICLSHAYINIFFLLPISHFVQTLIIYFFFLLVLASHSFDTFRISWPIFLSLGQSLFAPRSNPHMLLSLTSASPTRSLSLLFLSPFLFLHHFHVSLSLSSFTILPIPLFIFSFFPFLSSSCIPHPYLLLFSITHLSFPHLSLALSSPYFRLHSFPSNTLFILPPPYSHLPSLHNTDSLRSRHILTCDHVHGDVGGCGQVRVTGVGASVRGPHFCHHQAACVVPMVDLREEEKAYVSWKIVQEYC